MATEADSFMTQLEGRLLFAVPKKGRLHQASLQLLAGSDIKFIRNDRTDIALVQNLPLALVFLGAADIPEFVSDGNVDLGITGQDQVAEHEASNPPTETTGVKELMNLGFGKCKLQVQVPEKGDINTPQQLVGRNVATSFKALTAKYFRSLETTARTGDANGDDGNQALQTKIRFVGGSVEASCQLGVAHGIVDLVESGTTMRAARLKAIDTVIESSAVLICSKRPSNSKLVDIIQNRIKGVITAQKYVLCTYNINSAKLVEATKITPGKRSPTVTKLEGDDGWVAVQAMVLRENQANVLDELELLGATDILVTAIHNSRAM